MEARRRGFGAFLIGDDLGLTTRWGVIAVGLFTLVLAISVSGYYQTVYAIVPGRVIVYGAATLLVLLAGWQAYRNRGILVSISLCLAPVSALFIRIIGEGQTGTPTAVGTFLLGVGWGMAFGVPLGILGFLLGYAGRNVMPTGKSA
ncbi:hypothetical protein A4G99_22255 [Haladaptatus sp. R4]|uniref:hypothetical protein n=1 Tax=Haladaptatus sp. R4 TaxID=1679489 RepID=UPI0007B4DA6D|nr:hypothetical protein [Haladaptatus sp. R4]KZN26171.1 hypothetical protein A4G99_22255 [Haladaptatus sp. R4]